MRSGDTAAWLYGSHSRGDADQYSDVDVLIVTDNKTDEVQIDELLQISGKPSISRYQWQEIDEMAKCGSLFLRHLDLEGRPIFESESAAGRLRRSLSQLGPYTHTLRDLRGFNVVLHDIAESLSSRHASLIFELSTLGTVFRHASILGCAISGNPCFSRLKPVETIVTRWNLPESWAAEFGALYTFRMYADGRIQTAPVPSQESAWEWLTRARTLLSKLGSRINASC